MAENLPIVATTGKQSLSATEIKEAARAEAKRIKDETESMAYNMLPKPLEIMRKAIDAIIKSAVQMIDDKFKEETGMTIAEAKYKLDDGIQMFKRYKELGNDNAKRVIDNKKQNDKDSDKQELKEKKAKVKEKLTKWLEGQTDVIYNAFFLVQAKDLISEVKTVTSQITSGGVNIIQENIQNLRNLKQFFPGGGEYKKEKPQEDVQLAIENVEDDGSTKAMLSELAKSAKTTVGENYVSSTALTKKGLSPLTNTILSLLNSLLSLLTPLYTLIYNYNTNKFGLTDDGAKVSEDLLEANADIVGMSDTMPYETVGKTVNTSNTKTKKKLRAKNEERKEKLKKLSEENISSISDDTIDKNANKTSGGIGEDVQEGLDALSAEGDYLDGNKNILLTADSKVSVDGARLKNVENPNYDEIEELSISGGRAATIDWNDEDTHNYDTEFMKFLEEPEDLDTMEIPMTTVNKPKGKLVMFTPSSDTMYLPPEDGFSDQVLFSEIKRVSYQVDEAQKSCKYNPLYPLVSHSTKTNGGILENLVHSGNTKRELMDAILELNGGVRL